MDPTLNYFDILSNLVDDDDTSEEDDKTVVISNCSKSKQKGGNITTDTKISKYYDLPKPTMKTQYALFDSGATAHFLVEGSEVINKQVAKCPLKIKLPDGTFIESTHTCNLNIPWLPNSITEAHIVPKLTQMSLVLTRKFCDAGCKVIFDVYECRVYYLDKLVLVGTRDRRYPLTLLHE